MMPEVAPISQEEESMRKQLMLSVKDGKLFIREKGTDVRLYGLNAIFNGTVRYILKPVVTLDGKYLIFKAGRQHHTAVRIRKDGTIGQAIELPADYDYTPRRAPYPLTRATVNKAITQARARGR